MARVIAGIDLGATFLQSLQGVLEPGIVLWRGANDFTADGLFERSPDGGAQVLLMPNTGTLGTVRPVAGDYIEHRDLKEVMRVRATGGMDEVYWQLTCTPAIDRTVRPDAPSLTLAKLSNLNVKASVSSANPVRFVLANTGAARRQPVLVQRSVPAHSDSHHQAAGRRRVRDRRGVHCQGRHRLGRGD